MDSPPRVDPSMGTLEKVEVTLDKMVLTVGLLSVIACYLLSVVFASLDRIKDVDQQPQRLAKSALSK